MVHASAKVLSLRDAGVTTGGQPPRGGRREATPVASAAFAPGIVARLRPSVYAWPLGQLKAAPGPAAGPAPGDNPLQATPFDAPARPAVDLLWQAVLAQTGPAALWHRNNLFHHAPRYLADLRLIEALSPAGAILEIGAAPCHMTALLALSGHPTIGVDVDPGRVADLVAWFDLDVRRCDIERSPLPFDDGSFALALLCETFEHLRIDPAFVLSEIHRVLAPGGTLLLTTPNVYSLPSLGRFLLGRSIADPVQEYGKLRGIGHMGHVREYSAREVARFLAASGFTLQSIDYRSDAVVRGWKRRLLHLAYRLVPRRFGREIVLVATKHGRGPGLAPLIPLPPAAPPESLPP
jgi:SAM-dependent methyltransferase